MGYQVAPRSFKQIIKEIINFRDFMCPNNPEYLKIDYFLEDLGNIEADLGEGSVRFSVNYAEINEMPNEYGKTAPYNTNKVIKITIRNDVYEAACNGDTRSRFTIAHEIGHALLHSNEQMAFSRSSQNHKTYCDSEWQANVAAAALLLPPDHANKLLFPHNCVEKCGISHKAAEHTLDNYAKHGFMASCPHKKNC